jgi:hypothetical protein
VCVVEKTRKPHEKDGKLNLFFGRFLDNIFDKLVYLNLNFESLESLES